MAVRPGHVHVSALDALVVWAWIVVLGFLWRWASHELTRRGKPLGESMAFIY